jgi:two-component system nitrogen regulation sensor histidine kinase GlnL
MTPPIILENFEGLEHLASGVIVCSKNGAIRYINPSAEALLDISHDQACEKNINVFFTSKLFFKQILTASENQNIYRENEYFIQVKQDKFICVTLTVSPLQNNKNFLIEFLPMDQHLKVAKEERMIIQQQANAQLLRNLAHEIRNPLGGLRGAAQLLEAELGDKQLTEYTQIIIKEADRLKSLMNKLLSPNQIPKYDDTNIHEVIERVRGLILSEFSEKIKFVRDYDLGLPEIIADREKLIQAILNISRNAAQALNRSTKKEKFLKITTRADRHIIFQQKKYSTVIRIDIEDNGPGVPEVIKEKVFYPLVSGNDEGSGLGLSLAQNFISLHKGLIDLDSKPGKTIFTVILPIQNGLTKSKESKS